MKPFGYVESLNPYVLETGIGEWELVKQVNSKLKIVNCKRAVLKIRDFKYFYDTKLSP